MQRRTRFRALAPLTVLALTGSTLAVGLSAPAQADVSSGIDVFPYTQDWSDGDLITANDDWSGVAGVQGYQGAELVSATGVDPQTVLTSSTDTDVVANATASSTTGGVLEVDGDTIAIQGSGTADAPHVVFRLDLTGRSGASFAFTARDLDVSADNATQQVAVQYRLGGSGDYTNLPDGYIADATTASSATQETDVFVDLPADTNGQSEVYVRVLTTNAAGNDELVGIDDIAITADEGEGSTLTATDPGDQSVTVGEDVALTLAASGGTAPYEFEVTGLPDGLTATGGEISGVPTTPGTSTVTVTVTDAADDTASTSFDITVTEPLEPIAIAEIQGTGAASPLEGDDVVTTGVVTASYPTGGINGFYLQTGGTGTEPKGDTAASDAVFVYGGSSGFATYPEVGDSVQVTGEVDEFFDATQIIADDAGVEELAEALDPVTPRTVVPGTECTLPGTDCLTPAELAVEREKVEGELFQPTADYTVTDSYDFSPFVEGQDFSSSNFGELGLAANSDVPLYTPTDVVDAQDTAGIAARTAYNTARRVLLDDASSLSFLTPANTDEPMPWLTLDHTVRVGAAVEFTAPVVYGYRNNNFKLMPQSQVVGAPTADQVTIEQDRPAAPRDVGGDVSLATFNVLNYFVTLGSEVDGCSGFSSPAPGGEINNTRTCTAPNGPRGAWDAADLERQQEKIVNSLNTMDADVVSLEEIESSSATAGGPDERDAALAALVDALNADAGTDRWAFVPSPAEVPADEDVIRTAFIYDPATVELVGESEIYDVPAFDNARQPLAQAFKAVGASDDEAFVAIANHFKSKGSGVDDGTGQGDANPDRIAQAQALVTFAEEFAAERGTEMVFLAGDFNSYSFEDPVQELQEAGYVNLEDTEEPAERSYQFDGNVGSLDHVFANEAAAAAVTGVDIWTTNAYEPLWYEYSRYRYNVTELHDDSPFRASDHNPEIVGIDLPAGGTDPDPEPTEVEINLLSTNDFHGRIDANTTAYATTVEQLRAQIGEENTLFLSNGDNIGASLFASSVARDEPAIDVLNALDLEASAVGNHEFDQGTEDLFGRVEDRADFSYLGANVYLQGTDTPAMDEYDTFEVDGLTVGVIGAVTQETASLVSPGGIATIEFGDPVEAVNRVAEQLTDGEESNGEADVIVAQYHEGAGQGDTYDEALAAGGAFQDIAEQTSPEVDVIFNGHTHRAYTFDAPVPGETGTTRPILQSGQYGAFIGQVVLTVDAETGEVESYTQRNVARAAAEDLSFPRVAEVKQITDAALAAAAEIGNQPIAEITADITTAFNGATRDDRAAESTLGGLVANALRDGVSEFAEPDLGLTNPGGLRAELLFEGDEEENPENTDGVVTFAEANAVLPFNNTVALVEMTGAQLKAVLEQQWQTDAEGNTPSRAYLQLGLSDNVQVTADASQPAGQRVTSVRIDGELLDPAATYTVSTLSFLAQGGDNFRAFNDAEFTDTGLLDAELWRDYLEANSAVSPSFARRQVFAEGVPTPAIPGEQVSMQLGAQYTAPTAPQTGTTLDLTSLGSPVNTTVVATGFTGADGSTEVPLGEFAVTDGIAQVQFTVPASMQAGDRIDLVAQPSGTTVTLAVGAAEPGGPGVKAPARIGVNVKPQRVRVDRTRPKVVVLVLSQGERASGFVRINVTGSEPVVRRLVNGRVVIRTGPFSQPGVKKVFVRYNGNATTKARTVGERFRVTR